MRIPVGRLSSLLLIAALGCSEQPASRGVTVEGAWVRKVPPTSNVTAAYLTLRNTGNQADTLVSISSDAARVVEMHISETTEEGTMRMRRLKNIPVPAGEAVELKPGGRHLMLIGMDPTYLEGVRIPLRLTFRNAGMKLEMAAVKKGGPE